MAYFGAYGRQRLAPRRETRRGGPPEGSTRFKGLRARRAAAGAAPPGWPGRGTRAIAAIPASFSSLRFWKYTILSANSTKYLSVCNRAMTKVYSNGDDDDDDNDDDDDDDAN